MGLTFTISCAVIDPMTDSMGRHPHCTERQTLPWGGHRAPPPVGQSRIQYHSTCKKTMLQQAAQSKGGITYWLLWQWGAPSVSL